MDTVINVKHPVFGARGDGSANDRPAIQAAIDEATRPQAPEDEQGAPFHRAGVVVYFPAGRYLVTGGSLVLPRLPAFNVLHGPRTLILRGAGWLVSTIVNGNPTWDPENPNETDFPLFVADPDPGNARGAKGLVFQDLHLGDGSNNQEVFVWDVPPPPGGTWSADEARYRMEAFFERVVFSSYEHLSEARPYQPPDPTRPCDRSIGDRYLVRLHGADRTRFLQCLFYGLGYQTSSKESKDFHGGAAIKLCWSGGVTLTDCRTVDAGSMLEVEHSGELLVLNSRSEGAYGRPSWRFRESGNITLINPANEGRAFNPALFEFRGCRDVLVLNPQFAGPELPIEGDDATGRFPDGMLFENCENCRVVGGSAGRPELVTGPSYNDKGDKTAKLIRVRSSRYVRGSHVPTLLSPDPTKDVEIECSTDCCFELWGQHENVRRLVEVGCPPRDQLLWSPPLGFVALEGTAGAGTLTISPTQMGSTIRVTTTTTGADRWIALPLAVPSGPRVKQLTVCYQVSNTASSIAELRLTDGRQPQTATVVHQDATALTSTVPDCHESGVGEVQPTGGLTLSLRLNFADAGHHIDVGAIGVLSGP
jgi:Pectate lyase superfamily protein